MGLDEALTRAVADSGYDTATAVQLAAVPPALQGADLMVSASTGSGKTASFMLPALQRIIAARADTAKKREKGVIYG
ncbi:MAG: DEAD/DEAH box helicase, partial [Caldimonas sp.]